MTKADKLTWLLAPIEYCWCDRKAEDPNCCDDCQFDSRMVDAVANKKIVRA